MKPFVEARANAHPVLESPFIRQLNDELNREMPAVRSGKETAKATVRKVTTAMAPVLAETSAT